MYKTKKWIWIMIAVAVLILAFTIFASLLYVDAKNVKDIFNTAISKENMLYIISVVFFAIAAALLVVEIFFFILFVLNTSHNNQTIRIIKELKNKYALSRDVTMDEVDANLNELHAEVLEANKNNQSLDPIIQKWSKQDKPNANQTIVVNNNYNTNGYMPNNQTMNTVTRTTTTTTTRMVPPPPPPRPPMAPGAVPPPRTVH